MTGDGTEAARPATPAVAGTVVLLRDRAAGGAVEVLMVRRGQRAAFMPDAFVFPGGRVEPGETHGPAGAAAREAFEEAGVLLAAPSGDGSVGDDAAGARALGDPAWFAEARRAIHEKRLAWDALLAGRGLRVAVEALVPFARWVTPSSEKRRFDAHFFLARMPGGQTPGHDALEVVEHRFGTPAELLAMNARGEIKLPPPTFWLLSDLAAFATVDEALAWARGRGVTPVRPKLVQDGDTVAVILPWDPAFDSFPGEGERIDPGHPVAGEVCRFVLVDGGWSPRRRA